MRDTFISPFDPAVRDLRVLHCAIVNFVNYTALPGPVNSQGALVPLRLSLDGILYCRRQSWRLGCGAVGRCLGAAMRFSRCMVAKSIYTPPYPLGSNFRFGPHFLKIIFSPSPSLIFSVFALSFCEGKFLHSVKLRRPRVPSFHSRTTPESSAFLLQITY